MESPQDVRLRLTVHYDGSAFHGWQYQPDRRTIQGELISALSTLADKPVSVMGSGRTDPGVHATGQVACADMPSSWTPESLRRSLNAILPPEIWIQSSSIAHPDFHPRYGAIARTYQYQVGTEPKARSPFHARTCWALEGQLDYELLKFGASELVGEHSFKAFAKSGQPERGYLCSISQAQWSHSDLGFCFEITANRYLHHMVRYLVGTMVDIARVKRQKDDLRRLLSAEPDLTTSAPAPPQGLFLVHVQYPEHVEFSQTPPSASSKSIANV